MINIRQKELAPSCGFIHIFIDNSKVERIFVSLEDYKLMEQMKIEDRKHYSITVNEKPVKLPISDLEIHSEAPISLVHEGELFITLDILNSRLKIPILNYTMVIDGDACVINIEALEQWEKMLTS